MCVGGGGVSHSPPANYQAGSLNFKQPVPTLAGEICFLFLIKYCRNNLYLVKRENDSMTFSFIDSLNTAFLIQKVGWSPLFSNRFLSLYPYNFHCLFWDRERKVIQM